MVADIPQRHRIGSQTLLVLHFFANRGLRRRAFNTHDIRGPETKGNGDQDQDEIDGPVALDVRKHADSLEVNLRTTNDLGHNLGHRSDICRIDVVRQIVLGVSVRQTWTVDAGNG